MAEPPQLSGVHSCDPERAQDALGLNLLPRAPGVPGLHPCCLRLCDLGKLPAVLQAPFCCRSVGDHRPPHLVVICVLPRGRARVWAMATAGWSRFATAACTWGWRPVACSCRSTGWPTWAVLNDHIVDAALGYFVNPFATVTLAVVVLRERLRTARRLPSPSDWPLSSSSRSDTARCRGWLSRSPSALAPTGW